MFHSLSRPRRDSTAVTMLHTCLSLLLYGLVSHRGLVLSVEVTIPEPVVVGRAGASVILPCTYSTTVGSNFVVEWKFAPGSTLPSAGQQIYYYDGSTYKPGSQSERLSTVSQTPTTGTASIKLNNLSWSDNGTYICEVNNPPDFSGTGSGSVQLSVLVPPSTPTCQTKGSTITGQDGALTCSSTANPAPIYTWTFLGSKTTLLAGMMENQITGSLLLTNLSQAMSGTYRCAASNELGQATCQVTISVSGVSEAGTIAGAVVGVILGLLLIAAIVYYLLCYRKKRKSVPRPDHSGNDIREDAVSPMVPGEQSKSTNSSRDSRERHENRVV